jgi:hypothetical protein
MHSAWPGGEGLCTLKPTGSVPFDPLDIHITPRGFRLRFTEPLDTSATDPSNWSLERYTFHYHAAYGSPQVDQAKLSPVRVILSPDALTAEVELPELKRDYVYDFDLSKLRSQQKQPVLNPRLAYTVRRVPR